MNIMHLFWTWSRMIFGTVFVFCVLISFLLLIAELMYYYVKKSGRDSADTKPSVESGQNGEKSAENAGASSGKRIALITGASSGLGKTFALQIDRGETDIDEIWLVARRKERLEALAGQLSKPARIFALNLLEPESIDALERALASGGLLSEKQDWKDENEVNTDKMQGASEAGERTDGFGEKQDFSKTEEAKEVQRLGTLSQTAVRVGIFAGCAGFAKIGNYEKVSRRDTDRMIDLNCRAAVDATLAALPYMQAGDRIIEICSTAAFQPIQHMNLYAASKSFLYNYTRALRMELLPRGIVVTAVCPWWVKDTEFISVASDNAANPDVHGAIHGFPFAATQEHVVKRALRASRLGFAVSTPGIMCFLHRIFAKVIPRKWLLYFWELFRRVG